MGICVVNTCTRTSYTKVIYCLLGVGSSLAVFCLMSTDFSVPKVILITFRNYAIDVKTAATKGYGSFNSYTVLCHIRTY